MTRMILGPVLVVAFAALADARVLSQLDARAFTSSAACKPEYSWTDNSQHVSPCNLAAVVLGACAGNNWNIAPLDGAHFYSIPAVVNNTVNLCSCSWSAYNLISACTLCQGFEEDIQGWTFWKSECGDKVSDVYFPSTITLQSDTSIPAYAAKNPADWADAKFNLIEAKSIYTQGTPDLIQTQPGKKSSSTGAIVGGVVGGLAVVIIAGLVAFFMYRRRQRQRQPSATANHGYGDTSGHARNISDLSRKSNGIGLGYQTLDRSFATSPSSQPPMSATSGTMHTHTSSVNSLSYFGSANHSVAPYSSPSPPPVARTLSPSPPPHHMRMNREDIIVPFTLAPSPQAVSRQGSHSNLTDRKRADGAIIPVYDSPNSLPTLNNRSGESSGESNVPSRMRRNPPAYSAVDESSQVARSRPAHTKKGSSDTQHSLDSNTSGATTVRHGSASPGGGSVAAIDDVIGQMGFTQGGEESVSGSGGTLGTGQSRQFPRNPGFRPVLGNPDA